LRLIESRDLSIEKAFFWFSGHQRGSVLATPQYVLARVQSKVVYLHRPAVAPPAFLREQRSHVLLKRDFARRLSQRHERRQQRDREPNATEEGRVPQPEFPFGLRNTKYSTPVRAAPALALKFNEAAEISSYRCSQARPQASISGGDVWQDTLAGRHSVRDGAPPPRRVSQRGSGPVDFQHSHRDELKGRRKRQRRRSR
jgi:hypothetical protein